MKVRGRRLREGPCPKPAGGRATGASPSPQLCGGGGARARVLVILLMGGSMAFWAWVSSARSAPVPLGGIPALLNAIPAAPAIGGKVMEIPMQPY